MILRESEQKYIFPYVWNEGVHNIVEDILSLKGCKHIHIQGEAGTGKTRCAFEIMNEYKCVRSKVKSAVFTSQQLFDSRSDIARELLHQIFDNDDCWQNNCDSESTKTENFVDILCSRLRSYNGNHSIVFLIEDFHYENDMRDFVFAKIIDVLKSKNMDCMIISTSRKDLHSNAVRGLLSEKITLNALSDNNVNRLISEGCRKSENLKKFKTDLLSQSNGFPLFIYESMKILGLQNYEDYNTYDIRIPENMQSLYSMFFQNLNNAQKDILKAASVIGKNFSLEIIGSLLPEYQSILVSILDKFVEDDILLYSENQKEYAFVHDIQRDSFLSFLSMTETYAYNLALYNFYVTKKDYAKCGVHLYGAEYYDRAIPYLTYTGRKLLKNAQPKAAGIFFKKAFSAYKKAFKFNHNSLFKLKIDYCRSLIIQGEANKAVDVWEAIKNNQSFKDIEEYDRELISIEIPIMWITGQYNKDYALSKIHELPDTYENITNKMRLLGMLIDLGESDTVILYGHKLINTWFNQKKITKETSFSKAEISLYVILANAYAQQGDRHNTLKMINKSFALLEHEASKANKLYALTYSARALQHMNMYKKAKPLIHEAYAMHLEMKIGIIKTDLLSIYAENIMHNGVLIEALEIMDGVFDFAEETGLKVNKAHHQTIQAEIFEALGMYRITVEILHSSLEQARQQGNLLHEAIALYRLGVLMIKEAPVSALNPNDNAPEDAESLLIHSAKVAKKINAVSIINAVKNLNT